MNYIVDMKLHLLRHCKAKNNSRTGKDINRTLSGKGKKQANALIEQLNKLPMNMDIWCSQADRTRQTAQSLQTPLVNKIEYKLGLYLCSRNDLMQQIWDRKSTNDLLIIGHNFGISELASYFLDEHIELRTAEYVVLEFPIDQWEEASRGLATLVERYRPEI